MNDRFLAKRLQIVDGVRAYWRLDAVKSVLDSWYPNGPMVDPPCDCCVEIMEALSGGGSNDE